MNDSMIQNLLSDEQAKQIPDYPTLRLKIARILTPGPWKHKFTGDINCAKCDEEITDDCCNPLVQFIKPCSVPDLPTEPMEVLAERLLKNVTEHTSLIHSMVVVGNLTRDPPLEWFVFQATPAQRAVCALMALKGETTSDTKATTQSICFPVRAVVTIASTAMFWSIVDAADRCISSHSIKTHAESLAKLLNDKEQILVIANQRIAELSVICRVQARQITDLEAKLANCWEEQP